MQRTVILNIAMSLDGFIADQDGGFAWIHGDGDTTTNTEKQFNFTEFIDSVDTIVMGKKAYNDCPLETLKQFSTKKIYVATHSPISNLPSNTSCISGDLCSHVEQLKQRPGKNIWLWGGAGLVEPFLQANCIDQYVIGIIPTILGSGRPLFLHGNPAITLHLDQCTTQEGIAMLQYSKR